MSPKNKTIHIDLDGVFKAPDRMAAVAIARKTIADLRLTYRVIVCANRAAGGRLSAVTLSDWLEGHGIRCDGITGEKPRHRYDYQGNQQ